jgi:hypothetical protein
LPPQPLPNYYSSPPSSSRHIYTLIPPLSIKSYGSLVQWFRRSQSTCCYRWGCPALNRAVYWVPTVPTRVRRMGRSRHPSSRSVADCSNFARNECSMHSGSRMYFLEIGWSGGACVRLWCLKTTRGGCDSYLRPYHPFREGYVFSYPESAHNNSRMPGPAIRRSRTVLESMPARHLTVSCTRHSVCNRRGIALSITPGLLCQPTFRERNEFDSHGVQCLFVHFFLDWAKARFVVFDFPEDDISSHAGFFYQIHLGPLVQW